MEWSEKRRKRVNYEEGTGRDDLYILTASAQKRGWVGFDQGIQAHPGDGWAEHTYWRRQLHARQRKTHDEVLSITLPAIPYLVSPATVGADSASCTAR